MSTATLDHPTRDQFGAYCAAFDYFNEHLFDSRLPRCILNFSRHARFAGFFAPLRWARADGRTHEISLNPDILNRPGIESMSTLVHEMVHLWQQEFGKPSRSNYHNREWADRMEAIGLMPSKTGEPGGKKTGQGMTHYIIPDGPFDRAFQTMPSEFLLPWTSGGPNAKKPPKKPDPSKTKYTCPGCGANVWGKPELTVACVPCEAMFVADGE